MRHQGLSIKEKRSGGRRHAVLCMTYLLSYFLWTLGVPILFLAAGLMRSWVWLESRDSTK